jgi:hypothetical protein
MRDEKPLHSALPQIRVVHPARLTRRILAGHCAMRWRTSGISTSPPNFLINVSLRYWPRRGRRSQASRTMRYGHSASVCPMLARLGPNSLLSLRG